MLKLCSKNKWEKNLTSASLNTEQNENRPLFWPRFKTMRKTVQSVSHVFMQGYSIELLSRLVLYMYLC